MNIWLINHYAVPPQYYPLARPYNFAKYLIRKGHQVTIFAASTVHNSNQNLISDGSLYREELLDGIRYVYIRCRPYEGNGTKRIMNLMEFADKLPRVCSRYPKPDAIVATCMPPMSCKAGIKLARQYGCKAVAEFADLWPESLIAYGYLTPNNPYARYLRRMEKWIYSHADTVVFTMEGGYDSIVEQGWEKAVPREKVRFINNGVDLEAFDRNRKLYLTEDADLHDPDTFKVVYAGSIRRVNNLGLLLDAAKNVRNPKVRVLIWGKGDELDALQQRAADEKIHNVTFKGYVDKTFVPYILSCADLNIAHNEPSPLFRFGLSFNKIFDYFAAGKPILCDFPSKHNPVIEHEAGTEVTKPSAEAIASEIDRFAAMPPSQLAQYGANARMLAESKYNFEALTNELAKILEAE